MRGERMGGEDGSGSDVVARLRATAARLLRLSDYMSARVRYGDAGMTDVSDWSSELDGCAWDLMRTAEDARVEHAGELADVRGDDGKRGVA